MSTYDHPGYVEKRLQDGRDAESRLDALASQAARRHYAIMLAQRRIEGVRQLLAEKILTTANFDELLCEISRALEEANRVRATDEGQR